jgi:hypothetical protein
MENRRKNLMFSYEDRIAILEVIAKYSYTYDSLDAEGFASLFLDDALWEYYFAGEDEPEIRLTSRDEIREWAIPRLKDRVGKFISRHHQTSTVFESVSEDSAQTQTMVLVTHHEVGEPHPVATLSGVYHDTWKKTAEGWKFAQRILYTDKTNL